MNTTKRVGLIVLTLVAVLIGIGGVLPALAQVQNIGAIPRAFVGSYTLGIFLLTTASVCFAFYANQKRRHA
jgi:hypothetical protein